MLTPGVGYTAASGASYCSVPKPGTLSVLLPAFATLFALRPRRRQRVETGL